MSDEHKQDQNKDESLYKAYMMKTKNDIHTSPSLSEEEQREIIRVGANTARNATVMISLAILLLMLPIMTLITYLYYGIGGKANTMIDVVGKAIYITEPNVSLEEMEIESEIGLFSMNVTFDTFKRIGSEDYLAEKVDVYFGLDKPKFPEKISFLEQLPPMGYGIDVVKDGQKMYHPDAMIPFNTIEAEDVLNNLPDGTVAEAYLSFSELMKPNEIEKALPKEMEVRWLAVDTGLEAKQLDKEGVPNTPIGYPAQVDPTTWSPFDGDQKNEEVFLDILKLLERNEQTAEIVSKIKSLEIQDRRKYVEDNGIQVYGAVVTGPVPELRKLEQVKEVRAINVGEVKLWNWK